MLLHKSHPIEVECPISGVTKDLFHVILMPLEAADEDDLHVSRKEWLFGLPRGGLPYYLNSPENRICLREDICRMYARGEFILAPTYKTYMDTMEFIEHAGVKNRLETDRSPRRPSTSLASPERVYRYVFIPYTAAARALQEEFKMQPQTLEDLNGGIFPLDGKPCKAGSDQFPVLEVHAHPFSVCTLAFKVFMARSTPLTSQWHAITAKITSHWIGTPIHAPKWFITQPKFGEDDLELSPSEATGYCPFLPEGVVIIDRKRVDQVGDDQNEPYGEKVGFWVNKVDPDAPDPNAPFPDAGDSSAAPLRTRAPLQRQRSPLKLRRSSRLHAKACPYAPPSPARCAPPLSPPRRAVSALRYRDLVSDPPAWAKRNGRFPTPKFTSNDWAYFCYSICLNAPPAT
ncbi:hypothetical protein BD626DRAFT_570962 [Schizophyllum amplum]|uniref:Uncharacterized protein n=1 Tax=Schizophyllum amplum TaxID=97359 RepID=A0A550C936_9AGAR|nr:hypothetical protein BD626DRAFT_570962 [Auriculariopsis ampla]